MILNLKELLKNKILIKWILFLIYILIWFFLNEISIQIGWSNIIEIITGIIIYSLISFWFAFLLSLITPFSAPFILYPFFLIFFFIKFWEKTKKVFKWLLIYFIIQAILLIIILI